MDNFQDVIADLLRSKLGDLELTDKSSFLQQVNDDLKQHLDSLQKTEKATTAIFEGVRRLEKRVEETNRNVTAQRRLLEDIHATVTTISIRQTLAVDAIHIPPSSSLNDSRVTYRSYGDFTLRSWLILPEQEIWDAIRDIIQSMIQLKEMGYQFSSYPETTNLYICYRNLGNTFWQDQLGECNPSAISNLFFSSIDSSALPWRKTVGLLTTRGTEPSLIMS